MHFYRVDSRFSFQRGRKSFFFCKKKRKLSEVVNKTLKRIDCMNVYECVAYLGFLVILQKKIKTCNFGN